MGTPAPTAFHPATSSAVLNVVGARYVDDAEEVCYYDYYFDDNRHLHTYVSEAENTLNYRGGNYDNYHLYVSTTENRRMRTYLKFDLSRTGLYDDRYEHRFHDDVEIHEVKLLLYSQDVDLVEEPSEVMEILVPLNAELWAVENSAWDESITWITQPHTDETEARDRRLDNTDVDDEGEWVGWNGRYAQLTRYVREKWEKLRSWGKWLQGDWWDDTTPTLEISKFESAHWDDRYNEYRRGYTNFYNRDAGVNVGYNLTGHGTLTSSVFDAGDNNAFWNYVGYSYWGAAPTVRIRFDNDPGFTSPTPWLSVPSSGYQENIYARYAQYSVDPNGGTFRDITLRYTYHLSFVLREPEDWGTSTLRNQVKFISAEDWVARRDDLTPRMRIVYSRAERIPRAKEGMIDLGYIEYRAQNMYFPDKGYIYEGGMIIGRRCAEGGGGYWETVLAWPEDLVKIDSVGGGKVRIAVTRYQIEPSAIGGESAGGVGYTSIRIQREEEEWLVKPPAVPNRKEVTITIRTDHPSVWREYLERLAAEANYVISGYEEWDTYGDYVDYDYESMSLIIYGKDPNLQDILYSERVIWLDTSLGYYHGGRS